MRLFSELPLTIYGPSGTLSAISHRLKGYAWNLTSGSPFRVRVFEYSNGCRGGLEFPCHHSFDPRPVESADLTERPSEDGEVRLPGGMAVSAYPVQHGVPCLAYRFELTTPPKFSLEAAERLGLQPGPWVSALVKGQQVSQTVEGQLRDRDWLAERLLSPPVRHSLGFLTDTRLDDELVQALEKFFAEVDVLCCETAYLRDEAALARQNLHMTTEQAARLAVRSQVGALLIFHLSRRHCEAGNAKHLAEVRQVFANSELLESVSRAASGSPS